jgi:hypothetical protein
MIKHGTPAPTRRRSAGGLTGYIAVPAGTPHRRLVFTASGLLVVAALAIGAATAFLDPPDPSPPVGTPERIAYIQKLTPICQAWKDEAKDALEGRDPNIDPTQAVSFYDGISSILRRGSRQMQAVPRPGADTVVLNDLYNDLDLIVKYNDDMVATAGAGESSVAQEISRKVERQVQVYNQNAEDYGLNAACLMSSR